MDCSRQARAICTYLILLSRIHKQVQVTVNCSGNPVPVQIAMETALGVPGLPKIVFMCPENFHYSLGRSGVFVFSLDGFWTSYVRHYLLISGWSFDFLSFDLFANGFYKWSTCHTSVRTRTHIKLDVAVRHLYSSRAHSEQGAGGRRVPRRSHVSPANAAVANRD